MATRTSVIQYAYVHICAEGYPIWGTVCVKMSLFLMYFTDKFVLILCDLAKSH